MKRSNPKLGYRPNGSEAPYLGIMKAVGVLAFLGGALILATGLGFQGDDDSAALQFLGGSITFFGFGAFLGGLERGWRATAAGVMVTAVAGAVVLLNLGVPIAVVGLFGAAFALAVAGRSMRSGDSSLVSGAVGVIWAAVVVGLATAAAEPPPYFHDPFVGGFEATFTEAEMPVVARGEHAFSIRGRGSYTEAVTVLSLDVSDRCPDETSECLEGLLNRTSFLSKVDVAAAGSEFDVEVSAELGTCTGSFERAAETASYYREAIDLEQTNAAGWIAILSCRPAQP